MVLIEGLPQGKPDVTPEDAPFPELAAIEQQRPEHGDRFGRPLAVCLAHCFVVRPVFHRSYSIAGRGYARAMFCML